VKRNPKPTPTSTRRQRRRSERTGLIGRSRGHTPIDAAAPHHPQAVLESRCYPLPHNGDAVADGRIRSTCPLSPTQSIATVSRARRAGLPLLSNLGSVAGVGAETPPPPARAAFADVLAAGAIPAGEHGALVAEQAPARSPPGSMVLSWQSRHRRVGSAQCRVGRPPAVSFSAQDCRIPGRLQNSAGTGPRRRRDRRPRRALHREANSQRRSTSCLLSLSAAARSKRPPRRASTRAHRSSSQRIRRRAAAPAQ
jgi:hypothetical protein